MRNLDGRVALVIGGTYGVGRGVARALAQSGAGVFATGRSTPPVDESAEPISFLQCDHRIDAQTAEVFDHILSEAGPIDVLVNNVWGGYENMLENGSFTWSKPFWEQPSWCWDAMFSAGVRADYYASQLAAKSMVSQSYGVTAVSLYPGLVRTEKVMEAAAWLDLSNSESPDFIGRAVAALAADGDVIRHTGSVLVAAGPALEYGFTDIDGKAPPPLTLADV